MGQVREPIGKQDQYIAAIGGITAFTFHKDGRVEYRPCNISEETLFNLEDNLLLFFTGYSRSASAILKDQNDRSKQHDQAMLELASSRGLPVHILLTKADKLRPLRRKESIGKIVAQLEARRAATPPS